LWPLHPVAMLVQNEKMLDEGRAPPTGPSLDPALIDMRTLMGEARTMLYLGEAVDKTLKHSYHLKPVTRASTLKTIAAKGSTSVKSGGSVAGSVISCVGGGDGDVGDGDVGGGDNSSIRTDLYEDAASMMSSQVGGGDSGSVASSASSVNKLSFEGITFPLLDCEKFVGSCWRSFSEHASEPCDNMDLCQLALSITKLRPAIFMLSKRISDEDIDEYCRYFKLTPYSCLSWVEFKELCSYIFSPVLKNKMAECGVPVRVFNKASSQKQQRMNQSVSSPSLVDSAGGSGDLMKLPREGHPYGQMMRRHRYNSCLDKNQLAMPQSEMFSSASVDILSSSVSGPHNHTRHGYIKVRLNGRISC
jgi:UDP-N-acetylglucosamine transferase subunit ALG13